MSYAAAAKGQVINRGPTGGSISSNNNILHQNKKHPPSPSSPPTWKPSVDAPVFVPRNLNDQVTQSSQHPDGTASKKKKGGGTETEKKKAQNTNLDHATISVKKKQKKSEPQAPKTARSSKKVIAKKSLLAKQKPSSEKEVSEPDNRLLQFMLNDTHKKKIIRSKKFSPLKKKILEERLRQWKDTHRDTAQLSSDTILLFNFARDTDDWEDADERNEIKQNLYDMATSVGPVQDVHMDVPTGPADTARTNHYCYCFVRFEKEDTAEKAIACWNGLTIAGAPLRCAFVPKPHSTSPPLDRESWVQWCLEQSSKTSALVVGGPEENQIESSEEFFIALDNFLSEQDLEDEDSLEEAMEDVQSLARKYGMLQMCERDPICPTQINIRYDSDMNHHQVAAKELSKIVVGGVTLQTRLVKTRTTVDPSSANKVVLYNVVTEDDLEDPDCMEETLEDVRTLAEKYGVVLGVEASGDKSITVSFDSVESVDKAISGFNGMSLGGSTVRACHLGESTVLNIQVDSIPDRKEPLYSRDKVIPERFAKCLTVPKIPNSGAPRDYANDLGSEESKALLSDILAELMRLQKRALEEKNSKAKRRLGKSHISGHPSQFAMWQYVPHFLF